MKTKLSLLTLVLIFGVAISSCKKKEEPKPTPEEIQTDKLAKAWAVAAGTDAVTIAGNDVSTDWSNFELTFTKEGAYNSSSANSTDVWPASGTWDFATDDVSTLIRNDGIEISINVTDNALLMQFDYVLPGGKTDGVEGSWTFNMVPK